MKIKSIKFEGELFNSGSYYVIPTIDNHDPNEMIEFINKKLMVNVK